VSKPLVTIIVPTFNSEKTLQLCLESIRKQTYKNIEVIVVDNYSTDSTVSVAKKYDAKVIQVRGERARAKNIGLRHASGKYVLFIDSDMELTPRVVEECVRTAESNPKIAGIIIPEVTIGSNYWSLVRNFERSFYVGTPIESPRFFRTDLALKAGGFDEDIVFYEEATLPLKLERLGYNVRARVKSYILHHEENLNISKLLRKRIYYAKTAKKYITRYRSIDKAYITIQISPFYRFKLFFSDKRFWQRPDLALGVITLKILEYIISLASYLATK